MSSNLLNRRQRAIERHDRALDRWWPNKDNPEYRNEVIAVTAELETILDQSVEAGLPAIEQSRTARWLGDAYADLSRDQQVATGEDIAYLCDAVAAYQQAENLLVETDAPRDEAILNFNYANSLRRFDSENITLLECTKERYQRAIELFRIHDPNLVTQVQQALESVTVLIQVVPFKQVVDEKSRELEHLDEVLKQGGSAGEAIQIFQKILKDGGPLTLVKRVASFVENLPDSIREKDKDGKLQEAVVHALSLGSEAKGNIEVERNAEILQLLRERLQKEADKSAVYPTRAATLHSAIDKLESVIVEPADDIKTLMGKTRDIRQGTKGLISSMRELSYGLERPPEGSRAVQLLDLWWEVRRFLLTELTLGGQAEKERSVAFDLGTRSTKIDKRIVEAGDNDTEVIALEREAVRPLAIEIRRYTERHRPYLASPIWPSSASPTDPNAVFFSGSTKISEALSKICKARDMELLALPGGANFADRRWEQITRANVAIFDFYVPEGPELASIVYELGIAQSLGKSIVVLGSRGAKLPFDIDIPPVPFSGTGNIHSLEEALDNAVYWLPPKGKDSSIVNTIQETRIRYADAEPKTYITQTLKQLSEQESEPDPIEVRNGLETLISFLEKGAPLLIAPSWSGAYPISTEKRLFHVMPFGPEWANEACSSVKTACKACKYVRGDMVIEPQIIRSIWDEICRATHILVDITGFNANVAFELGVAHTLGKTTLIVGQENAIGNLFPMIEKIRVTTYSADHLTEELQAIVGNWLDKTS